MKDYNLGAANIPCRWDDQEFGEWTEITAKSSQFTTRDFFVEYGILIATVVSLFAFVSVLATITRRRMNLMEEHATGGYVGNLAGTGTHRDDRSDALMDRHLYKSGKAESVEGRMS